jgi:hypothetical protein
LTGVFFVSLLSVLLAGQPGTDQSLRDIQASHIEANVPSSTDFEKFLQRDLSRYFSVTRKQKSLRVEFELLRDEPTQSGVSYPRFYAWVRVAGGKSPEDRGAVRLAAIEKKRFEVTDFLSEPRSIATPTASIPCFLLRFARGSITR